MELLIVAALLGLITGIIASKKGRSFGLWWFFGAMLFVVALPMAILMQPKDSESAATVSRKVRPDNHVPVLLVIVALVGVGFFIYLQASRGGSTGTLPSHSPQPVAAVLEGLTGSQGNAVRSAKQYLVLQGFSREGLIQQLSSSYGDDYTVADATAAVDSLNVDWNAQAVRSAQQYLSMQGFSCNGLIEQLSSSAGDKYTVSQATYGARQAGAC